MELAKDLILDKNNMFQKSRNQRVMNLRQLRDITISAKALNYNRVLNFSNFKKLLKEGWLNNPGLKLCWNNLNTTIIFDPIMIHEHAKGEKVDEHIRGHLMTGVESLSGHPLLVDVPMHLFNRLEIA